MSNSNSGTTASNSNAIPADVLQQAASLKNGHVTGGDHVSQNGDVAPNAPQKEAKSGPERGEVDPQGDQALADALRKKSSGWAK